MFPNNAFDGLTIFLKISVFVLLPLSIWKLVEILIWLFKNINITIGN